METLYAVFDGDFSGRSRSVVESVSEQTPDWRHVPLCDCPIGHPSPTPRAVLLPATIQEAVDGILRRYVELIEGRGGQGLDIDDLMALADEGEDDEAAYADFERQRSLNVEEFRTMLHELAAIEPTLRDLALPNALFGPLSELSSKPVRSADRFVLRYGVEHHLVFAPGARKEVEADLADVVRFVGPIDGLSQAFVVSAPVRFPESVRQHLSLCPVCDLPTEPYPQGSLSLESEGLPELFYFERSGMLHTYGRVARVLEKLEGIELVPYGVVA